MTPPGQDDETASKWSSLRQYPSLLSRAAINVQNVKHSRMISHYRSNSSVFQQFCCPRHLEILVHEISYSMSNPGCIIVDSSITHNIANTKYPYRITMLLNKLKIYNHINQIQGQNTTLVAMLVRRLAPSETSNQLPRFVCLICNKKLHHTAGLLKPI